ncbi:hypothetical protein EGR_04663 [Echinococcus granulosus]|uniref:Uncharacterized protein n=1 Tax=Echinococcus granulosus TaxID=6210 RepID=W6V370_ECHGR|nr:hypothetical protein EGR_04663 [Echinococcus granulosus]EUB60469.1 hypothetical protein EGR_04663 [Echinococcus granulosus]
MRLNAPELNRWLTSYIIPTKSTFLKLSMLPAFKMGEHELTNRNSTIILYMLLDKLGFFEMLFKNTRQVAMQLTQILKQSFILNSNCFCPDTSTTFLVMEVTFHYAPYVIHFKRRLLFMVDKWYIISIILKDQIRKEVSILSLIQGISVLRSSFCLFGSTSKVGSSKNVSSVGRFLDCLLKKITCPSSYLWTVASDGESGERILLNCYFYRVMRYSLDHHRSFELSKYKNENISDSLLTGTQEKSYNILVNQQSSSPIGHARGRKKGEKQATIRVTLAFLRSSLKETLFQVLKNEGRFMRRFPLINSRLYSARGLQMTISFSDTGYESELRYGRKPKNKFGVLISSGGKENDDYGETTFYTKIHYFHYHHIALEQLHSHYLSHLRDEFKSNRDP